jgi:hypothetical protein
LKYLQTFEIYERISAPIFEIAERDKPTPLGKFIELSPIN